jgi:hypothetical protein
MPTRLPGLLHEMEVQALEETHVELLRRWIRNKKFRRYLIAQCYPIAIDGTQKSSSIIVFLLVSQ